MMPRLPVDGKKVIEYRVTLGTYEREQLNRFVDGVQIKNIGTGFGAATDPIEAIFSTSLGTIGGVYFVAWALKRFFDIDVPIPTDLEDIQEGWAIILDSVNLDKEGREKVENYLESLQLGKKASILGELPGLGGLKLIDPGYEFLKGMANFILTPLDNPKFNPNYGNISADYIDPGLANQGGPGAPAPPTTPDDADEDVVNENEGSNMEIWEMLTNDQIGDKVIAGEISYNLGRTYLRLKNDWTISVAGYWLTSYITNNAP